MSMADVLEDTTTVTTPAEPGDHDLFAHYVRKEDIVKATFDGAPVKAICGKEWVAKRSPEGKPKCPECVEIYDRLEAE